VKAFGCQHTNADGHGKVTPLILPKQSHLTKANFSNSCNQTYHFWQTICSTTTHETTSLNAWATFFHKNVGGIVPPNCRSTILHRSHARSILLSFGRKQNTKNWQSTSYNTKANLFSGDRNTKNALQLQRKSCKKLQTIKQEISNIPTLQNNCITNVWNRLCYLIYSLSK